MRALPPRATHQIRASQNAHPQGKSSAYPPETKQIWQPLRARCKPAPLFLAVRCTVGLATPQCPSAPGTRRINTSLRFRACLFETSHAAARAIGGKAKHGALSPGVAPMSFMSTAASSVWVNLWLHGLLQLSPSRRNLSPASLWQLAGAHVGQDEVPSLQRRPPPPGSLLDRSLANLLCDETGHRKWR